MRVLVTGCFGYIGSVLCSKLIEKYEVLGIDNLFYKQQHNSSLLNLLNKPNFQFQWLNFAEKKLWDKYPELLEYDLYIFLHSLVGAPICDKYPNQAFAYNFRSIKEFVEQLQPNQKVLLPNSNSAYGTSKDIICTEESEVNPLSVYAKSKMMTEKFLLEHHPNSCVLRLATVFGQSQRPRFDLLINNLTAEAFYNGKIEVYEGHFRRNFVHIQDVIRAFLWSFNKNIVGMFNVGLDSANCTKLELAHQISKLTGCAIQQMVGTDPDKRDYMVSSQKFMNTGFKFNHSLEDGISEIMNLCSYLSPNEIKQMGNYT